MTTPITHEAPAGTTTGPDVAACPTCGNTDQVVYIGATNDTVFALGERPGDKHVWLCAPCRREWASPAVLMAGCPNGVPWCEYHTADTPSRHHHSGPVLPAAADRCGDNADTDEGLAVTVMRSDVDTTTGAATVYVYPRDLRSTVLPDELGFSVAAARTFAYALLAAADLAEYR